MTGRKTLPIWLFLLQMAFVGFLAGGLPLSSSAPLGRRRRGDTRCSRSACTTWNPARMDRRVVSGGRNHLSSIFGDAVPHVGAQDGGRPLFVHKAAPQQSPIAAEGDVEQALARFVPIHLHPALEVVVLTQEDQYKCVHCCQNPEYQGCPQIKQVQKPARPRIPNTRVVSRQSSRTSASRIN